MKEEEEKEDNVEEVMEEEDIQCSPIPEVSILE